MPCPNGQVTRERGTSTRTRSTPLKHWMMSTDTPPVGCHQLNASARFSVWFSNGEEPVAAPLESTPCSTCNTFPYRNHRCHQDRLSETSEADTRSCGSLAPVSNRVVRCSCSCRNNLSASSARTSLAQTQQACHQGQ
jgi:hypothetical protein